MERKNPNDSPEADGLQDGTDQVALGGGGFQAHEGGAGFWIVQRGLK